MMPDISKYRQTKVGGWINITLIVASLVTCILMLATGQYTFAFQQLFLAYIFHWVNLLEKEITRRNGGEV